MRVLQASNASLARSHWQGLPTSRVPTAGWRVPKPRYATIWVTVGNPIVPCSVGHGFEVIARPMAKTRGDRVGDALCFHLASFESVACKARASDRLGVTPVGPRYEDPTPHSPLSKAKYRERKSEGRHYRECSEERHHRICDERVRERGLPVCKLKQSRSILISQICDVTNSKRLRSPALGLDLQ